MQLAARIAALPGIELALLRGDVEHAAEPVLVRMHAHGLLGDVFVATWLGHALGWYRPGQPAGFVGAVIGAMLILFVHRLFVVRRGH